MVKRYCKNIATLAKIAVSNTLSIHRSRWSKSIAIEAREFPEFAFMVRGRTFAVSNPDQLVASVKRNDVIEIDVPVDIYQKKLIKTVPMTFWDKSMGYHSIDVYGIRRNGHAYLTLTDINDSLRRKSGSVWIQVIMLLMGLCAIALAISVFLTGCEGCEHEPKTELEKLPPATQTGKNTFGCLVNVSAWVTEASIDAVAMPSRSTSGLRQDVLSCQHQGMSREIVGEKV